MSSNLAQDYGGGIYPAYGASLRVESGTTFSTTAGRLARGNHDSSVDTDGAFFLNNEVGWYEWDGDGGQDGTRLLVVRQRDHSESL